MHVTLRQLRMTVAIAEHRALSRAARALNVAQPSLTRSLRELEEALEVRLFERTPRGMTPTGFGEVLIRRGKAVEAELRGAEDEIGALQGGAGRVAVGATLIGAAAILPRALAPFAAEWPQITVLLSDAKDNRELAAGLLDGTLDFAVRPMQEPGPEQGLAEDFLFNSELRVWARRGHPLAKRRKLALAELAAASWILPVRQVRPRRQFDNAFVQKGLVPPRGAVETASLPAIRAMLPSADWLTLLPSHAFDGADDAVVCLPVTLPGAWRAIGITRRAGNALSPAARALIAQIRRAVRGLERGGPRST